MRQHHTAHLTLCTKALTRSINPVRGRIDASLANVPVPTFVSVCRACESQNQGNISKHLISSAALIWTLLREDGHNGKPSPSSSRQVRLVAACPALPVSACNKRPNRHNAGPKSTMSAHN